MPGLLKRWVKLHEVLALRHGPAAAILPPEVTKVHLSIAKSGGGTHTGARLFWKIHLSQLKYHNPKIPMIINRHGEPRGEGILSIYIQKEPVSEEDAAKNKPRNLMGSSWYNMSKPPTPLPEERVVTIETKLKTQDEILEEFFAQTGAQRVLPTEEEQALLDKFEEEKKKLEYTQSESSRLARAADEASAVSAKAKALALGTSA